MYVLGIMFVLLEIRLAFFERVLKTTTLNSGSGSIQCITQLRLTAFYLQSCFSGVIDYRLVSFFYPPWFRMTH